MKKNKNKTTRKIKKKAGNPSRQEIEKEENIKRQISNNLVLAFILSTNPDFSKMDARRKGADLDDDEYGIIVLIMQMELEGIIHKIRVSSNRISIEEVLFISKDMVEHRGDIEKIIDMYNNKTIGDIIGGKKNKSKSKKKTRSNSTTLL